MQLLLAGINKLHYLLVSFNQYYSPNFQSRIAVESKLIVITSRHRRIKVNCNSNHLLKHQLSVAIVEYTHSNSHSTFGYIVARIKQEAKLSLG